MKTVSDDFLNAAINALLGKRAELISELNKSPMALYSNMLTADLVEVEDALQSVGMLPVGRVSA